MLAFLLILSYTVSLLLILYLYGLTIDTRFGQGGLSRSCDADDELVVDKSTDASCAAMESSQVSLRRASLEGLPGELIYCILRELGPTELAFVSRTSKTMHFHAMQGFLWEKLILDELPCFDTLPDRMRERAKKSSFRELFLEHYPHWFLTRHKIWIGSSDMAGRLVIATYDHRRACIDGYRLLALEDNKTTPDDPSLPQVFVEDLFIDEDGTSLIDKEPHVDFLLEGLDLLPDFTWPSLPVVPLNPRIFLHLDRPVFHLEAWNEETEEEEEARLTEESIFRPIIVAAQEGIDTKWPQARPEKRQRPSRRQQPTSPLLLLQQPWSPQPSQWVRPIPALRRAPGEYAASSQFIYARELSKEVERNQGTFSLQNSRDNPPYSGTVKHTARSTHSENPLQSATIQFHFPPLGTTASRNLDRVHFPFPMYSVWPPPNVPTQIPGSREKPAREHRIHYSPLSGQFEAAGYRATRPKYYPLKVSEMTDRAFFMHTRATALNAARGDDHADPAFATIDPYYYTPMADKPFRGIWVGDYGGHGCEFLLIHQPDDDEGENRQEELTQLEGESDDDFARRQQDSRIYRGGLEAIKLTGDANVPQGEYSFFAPDLSYSRNIPRGRGIFGGKRIIQARGHIAGNGFRNARDITTRIIVVSFDQLAVLWAGAWYITLYHRVDIDQYISPFK